MSASERLRALDAPLPTNLGEWGDEVRRRGAIFLDALPQIVAVVEDYEKLQGRNRYIAALEQALTNPQGKD